VLGVTETNDPARTVDTGSGKLPARGDAGRKVANQYDRGYDYEAYWDDRDYENAAEQVALRKLLKGQRFRHAADIGGGFGRLCILLREYATNVTLAEPSRTQLDKAAEVLRGTDVERLQTQADALSFDDKSLDLVTMVRVMHHIPQPTAEFAEIHRVLADDGWFIVEVANYGHFVNRIKQLRSRRRLPAEPVSIRTRAEYGDDSIAFVNHNINTVLRQLADAGFVLDSKLSVSNLRSRRVKKLVPTRLLTLVEKAAQRPLGRVNFGPSIFLKLRKA
jgi:ubiquinone/menaquinone biosynthesis C-methylase UbiE